MAISGLFIQIMIMQPLECDSVADPSKRASTLCTEYERRVAPRGERSMYGLSLKPELIYIKRSISGKIHSAALAHQ